MIKTQHMTHHFSVLQTYSATSTNCSDILDNAGIGVFIATPEGRLLFASRVLADMYGYGSEQEMVDSMPFFFWRVQDHPGDGTDGAALLEPGEGDRARDIPQNRRDGTLFWASFNVRTIPGADGQVDHYQGIVTDVTERCLAEEALRKSEERYRRIAENLSDYLYTVRVVDGQAVQTTHGPACFVVTGYTSEEFAADPFLWINMVIPEDRDMVREQARQALAGHRTSALEHRIVHKDGSVRWVRDTVVLNLDVHGNVLSYDGLIKDITERKEMEETLRESESRVRTKLATLLSPEGDIGLFNLDDIIDVEAVQMLLEDFFNLTGIGSAIVDLQGKVLTSCGWQDICMKFHRVHPETRQHCIESDTMLCRQCDPGSYSLYKCKNNMWDMATPILVGGKHLGNLFLGQFFFADETPDYAFFRSQARQYGFNEDAYLAALEQVPRFNRQTVHLAMTFYTRLANLVSSLSYGQIKLARAMAEQRLAEEEIRWVNSRLEQSLEDKDKFFSIIAHDIRSPFIGFLSFIRLMTGNIETLPTSDIRKLAAEMKGNAENLYNLLENLLEWARMQRGFTSYNPQPRSLMTLIKDCMALVLPTATQKGIDLQCELDQDIIILADQPMLTAVIRNLLFNAVKFTRRQGLVKVMLEREENMVRVMVQDTGVGMNTKTMAKLFALDQKSSMRGTEGERGTGLGLILCKEFIEKHGGNIWAESTPGTGTTFSFTLPVVEDAGSRSGCDPSAPALSGL